MYVVPLQGIQEMSLGRLHPVSQFDPGPGVVEGAGSHDEWHISPEHCLMPPDRLRLQGCVQYLCVCICVYVRQLCVIEMLHLSEEWKSNGDLLGKSLFIVR